MSANRPRRHGCRRGCFWPPATFAPAAAFLLLLATTANAAPAERGVVVAEIRTYGNTVTAREIIINYCEFREGDVLSEDELARKIALTKQNLQNTQFFARVNVFDLPRAEPSRAVIMVDVAEGTTWHLAASTRQAYFSKENIAGRAVTLGAEFGLDRERLFYEQSWAFGLPLVSAASFFYENGRLSSVENDRGFAGEWFYNDAAGVEGSLGYIATLRATVGLALLGEYINYYGGRFKGDPFGRFGVADVSRLAALRPYAEWDGRDDDLYPTRGAYVRVEGELANRRIGDYSYGRGEYDLRGYVSPFGKVVFAGRLRGGAATDGTPYIRRLSIHGIDGLRTVNSNRTVGTRAFLASGEIRRNLFPSPIFDAWFEGVVFADAGRTWDPGQPFRFEDFDYAFGPALRLHMRGPAYFDWRAELNVHGDLAFYASAHPGF